MSDNTLAVDASGVDFPLFWVPEPQYGITALTELSVSDVTLTALEAAKERITLDGTLTSNISVILPNWLNTWKVANNCTGSYTVTVKTSAGTGVVVEQGGEAEVYGDGTNILIAAAKQVGMAVNENQAVTLGQAEATFAALDGSGTQQFSAAAATSADQVVNLGQAEATFAALAGSATQVFNAEAATSASEVVNLGQAEATFAALAGSDTQQFSAADATSADQVVNLGQAEATFAALAGSDTQQFSAATATAADQVVNLGQAEATFAALDGSGTQQFSAAAATSADQVVNLGQAEAMFAALAGSATQVFNAEAATSANEVVNLGQAEATFAALAGSDTQQFSAAAATAADQVVNLGQAEATFAELAGSDTQQFRAATATAADQVINLGQAEATFAALDGSGTQQFSAAAATSADQVVNLGQAEAMFAALAGSATQVFNAEAATSASEVVNLGQAEATFAALAGSDTQQFSAATATAADQVVNLGQAEATFAALDGSGTQQFSAAAATSADQVVNLGQAEATFAALAGSATQVFSAEAATSANEVVNLQQMDTALALKADIQGTVHTFAPNGSNLFPNGNGELGNKFWDASGTETNPLFQATTDPLTGEPCFANTVALTETWFVQASDYFSCVGGTTLTFSAEASLLKGTAGSIYLLIGFYDSSKNSLSAVYSSSVLFGVDYSLISAAGVVVPSTAAFYTVQLYSGTVTVPVGGAKYRRIKVEVGATPSTYSEEAAVALAVTTVDLDQTIAGQKTFDVAPIAPAATLSTQVVNLQQMDTALALKADIQGTVHTFAPNGTNLFPNGNGELGTKYWDAQGTAASVFSLLQDVDTGEPVFSNPVAYAGSGAYLFSDAIACVAGATYTLSGEGSLANATSGHLFIRLYFFDASGTGISYFDSATIVAGTDWTALHVSATAPTGAAEAIIFLDAAEGDPVAPIGGVKFRRLKIEAGSTPSTYSNEKTVALIARQTPALGGTPRMTTPAVEVNATSVVFTDDQVTVATVIGGAYTVIPNFSATLDLGITGIGGMDSGTATAGGFIGVYAAFNPTAQQYGVFATLEGSATLPVVYAGANAPSGYTQTALISVLPISAAAGQFQGFCQDGRDVTTLELSQLNSTSLMSSLTSLALSWTPFSARTINGNFFITGDSSFLAITVAPNASYLGNRVVQGYEAVEAPFYRLRLLTPKTIFYKNSATTSSTTTTLMTTTGYSF